ncbi:MAG: hypothetical protein MZU79_01345 [Anaerotruncus sp.]|nr:hypothetical protein [Anaerotruncus sp.]
MNLVARVQAILLKPKEGVGQDQGRIDHRCPRDLFMSYRDPLGAISAIAKFIGYGLIGFHPFLRPVGSTFPGDVLIRAILSYVLRRGVPLSGRICRQRPGPNFGSKQNLENAMKLVVYAMTPMWVDGIFYSASPPSRSGYAGRLVRPYCCSWDSRRR